MGINIKSKFRNREKSYKLNIKRKKLREREEVKGKKHKESFIKIVVLSPLIFAGFIKKIIDYYKKDSNYEIAKQKNINLNNNIQDRDNKNILLDKKPKKILIPKENKQNKTKLININTNQLKDKVSVQNKNNENDNQSKSNKYIKFRKKGKDNTNVNKSNIYNYQFQSDKDTNLEIKIFSKFKRKIITLKNNTDIIESELYLINKYTNDHQILEESEKIVKEIDDLHDRLEEIDKKFHLISDNNFITNPLLLDDNLLIDDIIKYREKLKDFELREIPDKLKLLDEYKVLYIKLEELENSVSELKVKSDKRSEELASRDQNYKAAKERIINLDEVNKTCNDIINKHNKYLDEILIKSSKIEEKKLVEHKLKGLNSLLTSSLKYIGLLSLTPLRGLIPGIAARTLATRKLVGSMIHNIHYEKEEKIVYSLKNYQSEINNKIFDINSLDKNIDSALSETNTLKEEFKDYFFKYNLEEYEIAYKKIEKIEEDIIRNKEKMEIIKGRLIKSREINKKNLTKIYKLNS